jgi:guanidinopropionase
MTVIHAEEFVHLGNARTVQRMREVVGDGPVYVSFDIDSLDPAFAPGTGTPEAGGLSTREAMELLRGCARLNVIGGDVVEVAPQYDHTTNTAQAAAQMLFEIVALVALARKGKNP